MSAHAQKHYRHNIYIIYIYYIYIYYNIIYNFFFFFFFKDKKIYSFIYNNTIPINKQYNQTNLKHNLTNYNSKEKKTTKKKQKKKQQLKVRESPQGWLPQELSRCFLSEWLQPLAAEGIGMTWARW